jgi:hypothetical protein
MTPDLRNIDPDVLREAFMTGYQRLSQEQRDANGDHIEANGNEVFSAFQLVDGGQTVVWEFGGVIVLRVPFAIVQRRPRPRAV